MTRACMGCHGQLVSLAVVRAYGDGALVSKLWAEALAHPRTGIGCPSCRKPMSVVMLTQQIELDLCRSCQSLWFDLDEFSKLPPRPRATPKSKTEKTPPATADGSSTPVLDGMLDILSDLFLF
jgi:Zn-finger nucleic acid-binding protein